MTPKRDPRPLLHARIAKRTVHLGWSEPEDLGQLKELFSYLHPQARFIPSVRMGTWDGMISLMRYNRVSIGLFHAKRVELEKRFRLTVTVDPQLPLFFRPVTDPSLRPYQQEAINAMIKASDVGGGIILSATGSGKTKLTGGYFQRMMGTGVFLVDELSLLEQARREISAAMGEPVGIVGRSVFQPERITVATVQTINKHRQRSDFKAWFRKVDVLVIDELHVQMNRRNFDSVTKIQPRAVFGLTATLELNKPEVSMPALALCGPVIFDYSIQQGTEEGYLSKGRIFIVPFLDPLTGTAPGYWTTFKGKRMFIAPGSPPAEYRRHIVKNKARNSLVEKLVRANLNHRIIVLVERKQHLRILSKRLTDLPHAALSGDVDSAERLTAMRQMDAGNLNLILATRVFAKGVDIRTVDCIIDATGMPSRNNVIQRYGRGVRQAEGKTELLFYDIADRGNGKFANAAWSRYRALEEIGAPITIIQD